MHKVDVSAALVQLGIDHPVEVVSKDLNEPLGPYFEALVSGGITEGCTEPDHPNKIFIDWDAIEVADSLGVPRATPANTIAHELVHVRQFQEFPDAESAKHAYVAAGETYGENRWEREAFERSDEIAPYVKVDDDDR